MVVQEVCTSGEDAAGAWVQIPGGIAQGAHIRRAGEDIAAGAEVIPAGTRLGPQHLGLAASVGAATLCVYRRLRVVVFSTGDELANPGEPLGPGQIYNSNRYTLSALVTALGCEVVDLGIVPDTLDATIAALSQAAAGADLILASGGVSVGEEDHVKPAVELLGSLDLWRIAMRPGKPVAFGHVAGTPFIGSPGNPVALFVTACLFARPFILRQQGVSGPGAPAAPDGPGGLRLAQPGQAPRVPPGASGARARRPARGAHPPQPVLGGALLGDLGHRAGGHRRGARHPPRGPGPLPPLQRAPVMIRVLYFARVREQLASPGEDLPADPSLSTAADLIERLSARGATWAEVFGPDQRVLVAINQELARPETRIADGDESPSFPR